MTRLVSWGELLWDLFPDGPRLGGGAANVAYHAAVLGAEAALVSRVGNDELGRRAVAELSAKGVDVSAVQVDAAAPTGSVRVELEDGEPRFTLAQGAAWDRIRAPEASFLQSADVICFGTLAQRTPLASGELSRALGGATLLRVCDLNVRPPHTTREAIDAAIRQADAIKLNEGEAAVLREMYAVTDAVELLLRSAHTVALTRGARGSTLYTHAQEVSRDGLAIPHDAGDRVGAGDAYTAVLALGLARRLPLEELAERANRYAAWVASMPGAMPPPPSFLGDVIIK